MLRYLAINQSLRAVNPFFTVFSFFENKFTLFVEMNTNISTFTLYEQFYIFNVTLLFCRRKKKKKSFAIYTLHTIFKPHQFSKLANVRDEYARVYVISYTLLPNIFSKDFHIYIYIFIYIV